MPIIYSGELSQRRLFFFTKCHMVIPRMVLNIMEPKIWATFQFKTLYSEFHPSNWLVGVSVSMWLCTFWIEIHNLKDPNFSCVGGSFTLWDPFNETYVVFSRYLYDLINCVNSVIALEVDIVYWKDSSIFILLVYFINIEFSIT